MSNLQIALNLARNGYYVHPLVEGDKIPTLPHGSNDATRNEDLIRAWWKSEPRANVGISLDKSGLVDIAPDCPEWAERFKANGLPRTTLYSSGGGVGHWHSLYRRPQGAPVARRCIKGQYDVMSQGNAVAPGSVHPSGRTYELHTPLLPIEVLPEAPAWAIALLQERPESTHDDTDWQALPSGATLAYSRRFQALCKANEQLRDVCAGNAVTLTTKDGAKDDSISVQRSIFVNQLLRAHYPHSEIRALAQHFSGVLESDPKWYTTDIDRIIDRYTPKEYKAEATRGSQAPRGGRHYEVTAGELLDRYHQHAGCGPLGIVLEWSVTDAADRLGLSTGTIKRREAELIEAGHILRSYGRVILSPDTWQIGSQTIVMPQTEQIGSQRIVVLQNEDEAAENMIGSQFDLAHSDAENVPESAVCEERARVLEITHSPVLPTPRVLRCGPWFFIADGVRCGSTASTEAEAWERWESCTVQHLRSSEKFPESANFTDLQPEKGTLDTLCPAEPTQTPSSMAFDDSDQPEAGTFTPVELPDVPYTAHSKRLLGNEERARLALEAMQLREQPENTVNLLATVEPEEPMIRCAPTDPKAANEYWALKHMKAKSPGQAIWMRRRIAELEVVRPLSEVGLGECVLSRAVGPPVRLHKQGTFL